MGQYEMRARLEELIGAERGHVLPGWLHSYGVRLLAEHLLAAGVLVPPVKEGQTVYAVLFEDGEARIWPWQVCGVAHMYGKWYAVEYDGGEWEVGGSCCFLTEQAAEEYRKQKTEERQMQNEKWIDAACPPAVSDEYIVQIAGAQKATCLYFDADEGVWFDDREGEIVYRVTKWMPLPPAEEVEGDA